MIAQLNALMQLRGTLGAVILEGPSKSVAEMALQTRFSVDEMVERMRDILHMQLGLRSPPGLRASRGGFLNGSRNVAAAQNPALATMEAVTPPLERELGVGMHADESRVLALRRCGPLGFNSHKILRAYLANFGEVVQIHMKVLVSKTCTTTRQRPSSLGFVEMLSEEAVKRILALGAQHHVNGVPILITKFEKVPTSNYDSGRSSQASSRRSSHAHAL